jgi:hypothetical protein
MQGRMLVIRNDQMARLAMDRARSLPRRIGAYLGKTEPRAAEALGAAGLVERVDVALARAALHGVAIEWDLCRFCLLAVLHGATFDELPWARDILSESTWSASERVDQLEQRHLELFG